MYDYGYQQQTDYTAVWVWATIIYLFIVVLFAAIASHKLSGEGSASGAFARFFWCGVLASPAAIVIVYCTTAFIKDLKSK